MKRLFELIDRNILTSKLEKVIARQHAEVEHPVITISREYGSGGSEIAMQVAKRLGKEWKVYHKEIVDELAKETRQERKLIREVDEKRIPLIEEITGDFFGKRYIAFHAFTKNLLKILSTIGLRGHVIIVGRGANFLFPDALKIRIVASKNQRVATLVQYEKVTPKRARYLIEKRDKERYEFMRTVYQHDHRKAHHYDLIIKIGDNITLETATKIIVELAKRRFRN